MIVPSPVSAREVKWKLSVVPAAPLPVPLTVYVLPLTDELPVDVPTFASVASTSANSHPVTTWLAPIGPSAAVNPTYADPLPTCAAIFTLYVCVAEIGVAAPSVVESVSVTLSVVPSNSTCTLIGFPLRRSIPEAARSVGTPNVPFCPSSIWLPPLSVVNPSATLLPIPPYPRPAPPEPTADALLP